MKKLLIVVVLIVFTSISKGQSPVADHLAHKLANAMRDSLSLNRAQRDQLYTINIQLHNEKTLARTQFQNRDSIGKKIQLIENNRDLLYKVVLSGDEYLLYRKKKKNIMKNN